MPIFLFGLCVLQYCNFIRTRMNHPDMSCKSCVWENPHAQDFFYRPKLFTFFTTCCAHFSPIECSRNRFRNRIIFGHSCELFSNGLFVYVIHNMRKSFFWIGIFPESFGFFLNKRLLPQISLSNRNLFRYVLLFAHADADLEGRPWCPNPLFEIIHLQNARETLQSSFFKIFRGSMPPGPL